MAGTQSTKQVINVKVEKKIGFNSIHSVKYFSPKYMLSKSLKLTEDI